MLIHASLSRSWLTPGMVLPDGTPCPAESELVFGAIVGQVELVGCLPLSEAKDDAWAVGPWCWLLANPVAFEPVPCKGALSFWRPSLEVEAAVRGRLA